MKRGKKIKDVSLLEVTHSCVSYKSLHITFILYPYRNKLKLMKKDKLFRDFVCLAINVGLLFKF